MTAFVAVWSGVLALLFALVNLTLVPFEWRLLVMLYWGFADALPMTLGFLVLWGYRKSGHDDPGVCAQRTQCWVAIGLAAAALAANCTYLLWYYLTHVRPHLPAS